MSVSSARALRPSMRPVCLVGLASSVVVLAYAAALFHASNTGGFLYDELGRPIASDFVNVWAAGKMVLEGRAAGAYDWAAHKLVEASAVGWDFDGYFGWHYPPPFLAVAAPLALLAYPVAHLVWMALTAPLYMAAVARIAGAREAALAALAFPAAFWNFGCGQNGFLTAALLGLGLALLKTRPILAGVLIGLLAYKPQFGLLIPIALVAGGHWRAVAAAAATVAAMALGALVAFGPDTWLAFVHSTGVTNQKILVEGRANFAELLSAFGMTRWLGGGVSLAWAVQGAVALGLAAAVWRSWRGAAPFADKAALLVAAALMATPYLYVYDLVALAAAIAFLARTPLTRNERSVLVAASLAVLAGPVLAPPLAFLAAPAVAAVALARVRAAETPASAPAERTRRLRAATS